MCDCNSPKTIRDDPEHGMPMFTESIPIAGSIVADSSDGGHADGDAADGPPIPRPFPGRPTPLEPFFPHFQRCNFSFPNGCWMLTITPITGRKLVGTLRVDRGAPASGADSLIFSGDLYRQLLVLDPHVIDPPLLDPRLLVLPRVSGSIAGNVSRPGPIIGGLPIFRKRRIPIFPRAQYHSYLKGIRLSVPLFSLGKCKVTIDVEQFDYTHPPAGSFQGSFPATASRTLRFSLDAAPDPLAPLFTSAFYTGRMSVGGVDTAAVELVWVSSFMRRAVLEIDTLTGAVAPQPVPNAAGTGTEFFDTVFAQAGWQLTVVQDQTNIPVPAGVTANACWSSANLHALMLTVRNPATNLDAEWRTHLVVVPATMGCSRGVMYDQIGVPREGSASFSNDGYPVSNSANFGTAANQQQRNVPRAFLRSATHEVTHAFNQIHQESETVADNSIMTTTPSVADVLGGPATGAPGVFPDQINLGFNTTVRNHLAHMPDPIVRPGGWPFASWFGGTSPQASDYNAFDSSEISLDVMVSPSRPALGQPVLVTWTLANNSSGDLMVPNDVSLEGTFATMEVTDGRGTTRPVRSFAIICDDVALRPLSPGATLTSSYRAFWSTAGFAFERPGRHELAVSVAWSASGVPVYVRGSAAVHVDFPLTDADNAAAALAMHPSVGMWVALDGKADHLTDAVERVAALTGGGRRGAARMATGGAADGSSVTNSRTGQAFADLASGSTPLPTVTRDGPDRLATRGRGAAKKSAAKKSAAKKSSAKKSAAKKSAATKPRSGVRTGVARRLR